jgi:hypothetical protein
MAICSITLTLTACGNAGSDPQEKEVSRAEMGAAWPLTVDSGTLRCEGSGGAGAVFFEHDGRTYTVNGTAKGANPNMPNIVEIWATRDMEGITGIRMDISPLIQKGLSLCT